MKTNLHSVYKSKRGFFYVFVMTHGYAVYNSHGHKIAFFEGPTFTTSSKHRSQRMAELCADALETEFQW